MTFVFSLHAACSSTPETVRVSPELRLMALIDVDGDGALDADEYQRVSLNDRDQHDEVPDFEEADTDGDAKIDNVELRALLLSSSPQFARLMLNRNRRALKSDGGDAGRSGRDSVQGRGTGRRHGLSR